MKRIARIAFLIAFALAVNGVAHGQNTWQLNEIYSTADGAVQFIQFYSFGSSTTPPSLADLQLIKPDFVVPNGFLFVSNGSVRLGSIASIYASLPADGENARWWQTGAVFRAEAVNNASESYIFMPMGVNPIVEYYNDASDDYFLTAYSWEIQILDAHGSPGWRRTGYSLPAWTSPFATSNVAPRNLLPVCRLWLVDSHFYSISNTECADVLAQYRATHSESPLAIERAARESYAAFFAMLPDVATGECPTEQAHVYRLASPRGAGHRYTTETTVRDEMIARGFIAEGYGAHSVAMCVGGSGS